MSELINRLATIIVPVALLGFLGWGMGFDITRIMWTRDYNANMGALHDLVLPGNIVSEAATCGVFVFGVVLITIAIWSFNEFRHKV